MEAGPFRFPGGRIPPFPPWGAFTGPIARRESFGTPGRALPLMIFCMGVEIEKIPVAVFWKYLLNRT